MHVVLLEQTISGACRLLHAGQEALYKRQLPVSDRVYAWVQVHMVALDTAIRAEIVRLAKENPSLSHRAIAKRVKCTGPTVKTWLLRSKSTPSLADRPKTARTKLITPAIAAFVLSQLRGKTPKTSVELASKVEIKFQVKVSPATMQKVLKRRGCTWQGQHGACWQPLCRPHKGRG